MLWISAAAVSLVPLSTNYFGTPYGEVQNGTRWKWPIPIKYIILSEQVFLMDAKSKVDLAGFEFQALPRALGIFAFDK